MKFRSQKQERLCPSHPHETGAPTISVPPLCKGRPGGVEDLEQGRRVNGLAHTAAGRFDLPYPLLSKGGKRWNRLRMKLGYTNCSATG
ncbi:hypothetical protein NITLEN_70025 [Nitrospira lenta]|uniref:Uncharacterized protein n=1 Tax=Nitrospira lenta TaxID=1436998 RepID=A0A330L8X5_9BACT|nr:hypothetical protein NITLEN_70025 [Nitrospira lenta]